MAKGVDSREKTLAAAAKLFRRKGYHGTALQEILQSGGAPRGSLYFHFPNGKEEIGVAALALAGAGVRRGIAHAAETSESDEIFLTRIARGMLADLEKSDYTEGCPIATTALETAAQSEALSSATRNAFQEWEREIGRGLERFGMAPADAEEVANLVLSQLEGALLLARTYRSPSPMLRAEKALKLLLRAAKSG
jgi:TetR/AcrR family transcriptional repressor of lmrAB and yxaGH operons